VIHADLENEWYGIQALQRKKESKILDKSALQSQLDELKQLTEELEEKKKETDLEISNVVTQEVEVNENKEAHSALRKLHEALKVVEPEVTFSQFVESVISCVEIHVKQ